MVHTIGIDDVDQKDGAEGTGLNHNFERRQSNVEVSRSQFEAHSTHGVNYDDKQMLSQST